MMRIKISAIVAVLTIIVGCVPPCLAKDVSAQDGLQLKIVSSRSALAAPDVMHVTVTLSTTGDDSYIFHIGSFAELFGVYLLGPWGVVQPDSRKILTQNWMHQQHSPSTRVLVKKGRPFETSFKLSDYYDVKDKNVFREGRYQLNVKFYAAGLGMKSPLDSMPIYFDIRQ